MTDLFQGYELVELYTKRNFRCDCGTSRMTNKCKLEPNKEVNTKNRYNQNFLGLYCVCHRPYPDPEDNTDDVMIQCVVCEDWLHGRHLNMGDTGLPEESSYSEMICFECVEKLDFLQAKEVRKAENTVDKGMEALGQMDRVKQVEAIAGYNNMKQNLMEYLSKFANNKKVVREEDIKDFFDGMKNKRRRFDGPDSFA